MEKSGKAGSKDSISKAVLRSQPPHAADVPDMVDWYQKWGGGASEYYVNDLAHFCKVMNISPSVRVSGRHFKALAALAFGTAMPSHAVTAVLKRIAASGQTTDGVASSIAASQIAAFCGRSKEAFLKANEIIKECETILTDSNIDDPMRTISAGWLQMTLIDHILGRPNKTGHSFVDMESIVKDFLKQVFGDAKVAPVDSASSSGIVQYDEMGSAIDVAKMVLVTKGYKIGKNYFSPKQCGERVWKLISIDGDGTSKLEAISAIGELIVGDFKTITGAELAGNWTPFDKLFKTLGEYPSNEGKYSRSMKADIMSSRVKECLMTLAETMIDQPIIVRTSPTNAVIAKSEIALGKLRLSPVTGSMVLFNSRKKGKAPFPHQQCTLTCPDGSTMAFVMGSPVVDQNFCSAFFVVRVTHVEELGNMALTEEEVPFILASRSKLRISGFEHIVKIPVFYNQSIIKQGEELMFFVKEEKMVKEPAVVKALQVTATIAKPSHKRMKVA